MSDQEWGGERTGVPAGCGDLRQCGPGSSAGRLQCPSQGPA